MKNFQGSYSLKIHPEPGGARLDGSAAGRLGGRVILISLEGNGSNQRANRLQRCRVPEISRFFGIVIRMHFDDHSPPHFHAHYSGMEASVRIDPIGILTGDLPPRVLALVIEWGRIHQAELIDNWRRLRADGSWQQIPPLE